MRVRVSPAAPYHYPKKQWENIAYIVGVALGDGNLSNPNGKAVRLRITCDLKYPLLIDKIIISLQLAFPKNKVTIVQKKEKAIDISVYSNILPTLLTWKAGEGTKINQSAHVPAWIKSDSRFTRACLQGLFETDGCVYLDRGYTMAMFTTAIPKLASDVSAMIQNLGFMHRIYKTSNHRVRPRYNIRISKRAKDFVSLVKIDKR